MLAMPNMVICLLLVVHKLRERATANVFISHFNSGGTSSLYTSSVRISTMYLSPYTVIMQTMAALGSAVYALWGSLASIVSSLICAITCWCGSILDAMLGCEYTTCGGIGGRTTWAAANIDM